MRLSAPVRRLRHRARQLARSEGIPLHAALDRVAAGEGFARWSLLVAKASALDRVGGVLAHLSHGDMLLLGARPGQGKTLFGFGLMAAAMRAGRSAALFTLEETAGDVIARFRAMGIEPSALEPRFRLEDADEISASLITAKLASAPPGTIATIDYLQLLDQRRDKPALSEQVAVLRRFARERGVILIFLSQIDRSYDPSAKPFPDLADIRLPNPLDLGLFSKACFLNEGAMRFENALH
jgi:replicative DNA helicase